MFFGICLVYNNPVVIRKSVPFIERFIFSWFGVRLGVWEGRVVDFLSFGLRYLVYLVTR